MTKRLPPLAKQLASKSFSALTHHLTLWHQVLRDHTILDRARNRIVVGIMVFAMGFLLVSLRLFDVMVLKGANDRQIMDQDLHNELALERADIVDRHGEVLATHLITASVYANPKVILNARDAAEKLCALVPELDFETVLQRLQSEKGFVWILRHISPKLQQSIHHLGIPGIYLQKDQRRVYPFGPIACHVLGYCGLENKGLSGIEQYFDVKLRQNKDPLQISLDMRVQHVMHDVLKNGVQEFQAHGGNAMLLDISTGQLLGMVSLPDFDPNQPSDMIKDVGFNRNTLGVYEPGSTFKMFNTAIALETNRIKLNSVYDATHPIKIGRFTITDFRGQKRPLTVQETFLHSSNIASAKMALDFGLSWQQKYFATFGMFSKASLELPEVGSPIVNKKPTEATLISNSFGYGISVSPLQTLRAVAAIINSGQLRDVTLLKQTMPIIGEPIVSESTSKSIRKIMRCAVVEGTVKKAEVPGYHVIGKTGSAYIVRNKRYHVSSCVVNGRKVEVNDKITTFIGAFPGKNPKYLLMVMLDSPKPTEKTYGFSTGGWNACPTGGKMIERLAPMLGLAPDMDDMVIGHNEQNNNVHMVSLNGAD